MDHSTLNRWRRGLWRNAPERFPLHPYQTPGGQWRYPTAELYDYAEGRRTRATLRR
jgi:hypothetical protein